jgi:hypothetical protein
LRGLRERADEDEVKVFGQLFGKILKPGIAYERDFMPFLFAPDGNYGGHNAGKIRVHNTREQRPLRAFGNKVYNSYAQFSQNDASYLGSTR